jgi:hypothetical protein
MRDQPRSKIVPRFTPQSSAHLAHSAGFALLSSAMDKKPPHKIEDVMFHREKFDAVLKKIAETKPLQRKELLGTFPRLNSLRRKPKD